MNKLAIKMLNKLGILKFVNLNGTVLLNGRPFKIPIVGSIGYTNLFMSEPWMISLLKIILPIEEEKFVDVGVNIGQTLLKLRSVSDSIEYVGFEPNPSCINYLNRLIKANGINRLALIPVGVSDKTELGELHFFDESGTDSCASMIAGFRPGEEVVRKEFIPVFGLEDINKVVMIDKLSVLKIDVEGAELEVLKSFYNTIEEKKPIILIEILPAYNQQNKSRIERQHTIQELLTGLGYAMYRVIKKDDILLDLREIKEIGIHDDLNDCEYVMVPSTKKESFEHCAGQVLRQKQAS